MQKVAADFTKKAATNAKSREKFVGNLAKSDKLMISGEMSIDKKAEKGYDNKV